MTTERAINLQQRIAREAVASMVVCGSNSDTTIFKNGIELTGKAWGVPAEDTERNCALITQEEDVLRRQEAGEKVDHVLPESELPMNASGVETLDNIWDIFETAVRLAQEKERMELFTLARELSESQNLLDWIEKTPAEQASPEFAVG